MKNVIQDVMQEVTLRIKYTEYETAAQLAGKDNDLIMKAREAAKSAYAPYSGFRVGAAVLLQNGVIITGNNQENAAYPSGLCAERTALFYASSQFPAIPGYRNCNKYHQWNKHPIRNCQTMWRLPAGNGRI